MTVRSIAMVGLAVVIAAAGCTTVVPDPCHDVIYPTEDRLYIALYHEGVAVEEKTEVLAERHDLDIRSVYPTLGGFSAYVPTRESFDGLRCEPSIRELAPDGPIRGG